MIFGSRKMCALWLLSTSVMTGCIPSEAPKDAEAFKPIPPDQIHLPPPEQTVATPEELVTQFTALAKAATKQDLMTGGGDSMRLIGQLMSVGDSALAPVIDLLNAADCGPLCQVYVEAYVGPHITKSHTDQLLSLLATPKDDTTKACVVALLGSILGDERIAEALRPLTDHPDKRIKLAALGSLATNHGDASARASVAKLYHAPGSTSADRQRIIFILLAAASKEDVPLFTEALLDKETDPQMRSQIAMNLGRVGGLQEAAALEQSAELSEDPQYRSLAKAAAGNIRAKSDQ